MHINVYTNCVIDSNLQKNAFSEKETISLVEKWFITAQNGDIETLKSLLHYQLFKNGDDKMIYYIGNLAHQYLQCLMVHDNEIKCFYTMNNIKIIQNNQEYAIIEVNYEHKTKWLNNQQVNEKTAVLEWILLKKENNTWYILNSQSIKNN